MASEADMRDFSGFKNLPTNIPSNVNIKINRYFTSKMYFYGSFAGAVNSFNCLLK